MADKTSYRIMGIDPGTNYMGYGVLEIEGRTLRPVVLGDIDLHRIADPYAKLRYIFERVGALCDIPDRWIFYGSIIDEQEFSRKRIF